MLRYFVPLLASSLCLLAACIPSYNWRQVQMPDVGVKALLPCKPDQGSQQITLAGQDAPMHILGCQADDALFVLARVNVGSADKLLAAQAQWQSALLGKIQAQPPQLSEYLVKGASALPKPVRLQAQGRRPDGSKVVAHALWFAQGTSLYHAVVYTNKSNVQAVETFFSGIELP
jgi:hypothetical protein